MNAKTHTPTPWRHEVITHPSGVTGYIFPKDSQDVILIVEDDAFGVAKTRGQFKPEMEELCSFITRAVNSHEALVTALIDLVNYVDTYKYGSTWAGRPHKVCDAARSAVALTNQS